MSTERHDHSRPSASRATTSSNPVPYLPQPESLVLPEGAVSEQAAELLNEFVHGHGAEPILASSADPTGNSVGDQIDKNDRRPWWKRPSPLW